MNIYPEKVKNELFGTPLTMLFVLFWHGDNATVRHLRDGKSNACEVSIDLCGINV